jgi:hypothetical protein
MNELPETRNPFGKIFIRSKYISRDEVPVPLYLTFVPQWKTYVKFGKNTQIEHNNMSLGKIYKRIAKIV